MSGRKDGGPAYPFPIDAKMSSADGRMPDALTEYNHAEGMSLRDWFAGQALASFALKAVEQNAPAEVMAQVAYRMADAMLAERER